MNRHPDGEEHTHQMLLTARDFGLRNGVRILDMGAGAGETVRFLQREGFKAEGIDLKPRSELVREGDMHGTDYPDESFDAVISQCAFFVSGDPTAAAEEARRVLKPDGLLLLSDVFFSEPMLSGFRILYRRDMTPAWREYYIEALWRGETCECEIPKGKSRYLLLIAKKEER